MPRASVESLNMVLDKHTQADSSGATAFPTGSPWMPGGSHHREGKGCTLCPAVVISGHVWEEEERKRKEEGGPGSLVAGGTVGDREGQCPGVMDTSRDRSLGEAPPGTAPGKVTADASGWAGVRGWGSTAQGRP